MTVRAARGGLGQIGEQDGPVRTEQYASDSSAVDCKKT